MAANDFKQWLKNDLEEFRRAVESRVDELQNAQASFHAPKGKKGALQVHIKFESGKLLKIDIGDLLAGLYQSLEPRDIRNIKKREQVCDQFDYLAASVRRSLLPAGSATVTPSRDQFDGIAANLDRLKRLRGNDAT